jgi:5-methylcytosine-specific restriction endonuclease McrA
MKLKKNKCEICGITKKSVLHIHHIIPRRDSSRCTNLPSNLTCLCSNCHNQVHAGEITIIGVYTTTEKGRTLFWFKKGEEPPLEYEYWLIKDNPYVIVREYED